MSETVHRAGYVALVGRPNVGKSTLLNRLVGQKISITSRKPQTTRQRITGILTRDDAQLVFVDTPGFQEEHKTALNRLMNRSVAHCLHEVDVVVWLIEALRFDERDLMIQRLLQPQTPVVLAVSKIDRVQDKRHLLPFIQRLDEQIRCSAIVPTSAQKGLGAADLLGAIIPLLPVGPPFFEADEITSASERVLAAELLREKLFRLLGDELPYAAAVEIERFESRGNLRRIHAAILLERDSQKAIVIGKGGEKLKQMASQARREMEDLFGGKVYLEVWAKVRRGWANDEKLLKRLGLEN